MTMTKLTRTLWILPLYWLFLCGYAEAETLHAIRVADTTEPRVTNHLVEELSANHPLGIAPLGGQSGLTASDDTEDGGTLKPQVERVPELPMVSNKGHIYSTQSTDNDENDENSDNPQTFLHQSTVEPLKVCPKPSSSFGSCYWEEEPEENRRKWSVFLEEKLWLNRWQGWALSDGYRIQVDKGLDTKGKYLISRLSESELISILTFGFRYDQLSLGLSYVPTRAYGVAKFVQPIEWYSWHNDENGKIVEDKVLPSDEEVFTSIEREELDITIGYSILPQLTIGAGFKRVNVDYTLLHYSDNPFEETPTPNENWNSYGGYKIYGASLNIGGQACLANLAGVNISMFGSFSYGLLKTKFSDGDSDPNTYHSTDLGLALELPKIKQLKSEIRFGYRAQTMYTETIAGDAVDTAEGFTLGLRVTY